MSAQHLCIWENKKEGSNFGEDMNAQHLCIERKGRGVPFSDFLNPQK
jgi:hypothetical protein